MLLKLICGDIVFYIKMAKEENDHEMMRHYEHVKCLENIPNEETLLLENRQKVHDEMMKKDFWGEEYSLRIFERELNIKIILRKI